MLIVGLGAVFAILALLWGVLVLARILLHDMPARRREEKSGKAAEPLAPAMAQPVAKPAPAPVAAQPAAQPAAQDNGVLIAVITAAVSAAMAEEGTLPPGGFRVVSFRRASNTGAWNRK
jgi:hypothetical protein